MNKQAIVNFIQNASEAEVDAFLQGDPVVIKEVSGTYWSFEVQTEEGVGLNGFSTREGAEHFCKDLGLEVKEEKTFYIESWKCEGDCDGCGTPCTVELVVEDLDTSHYPRFSRACLSVDQSDTNPKWVRLPDKPYEGGK